MRQILILLCMTHFMYAANAQQKDTSSFLFDEFQNAVVIFKDGSQYHEKMNYNILLEKFFFIDRADQTKKILSNPQDVRVIQFGNRVFYMEGDKGIEIIPINPTLYVQYKGNIEKKHLKVHMVKLQRQLTLGHMEEFMEMVGSALSLTPKS